MGQEPRSLAGNDRAAAAIAPGVDGPDVLGLRSEAQAATGVLGLCYTHGQ
ncbi:MAG: hypothetical protein M1296_04735 [Chloroflexi bacterium]|nr:hypothetical protein [Chloroflexota bacterium]